MEPERAPKSATQTKSKDLLRLQKAVYGLIDQPTDPKEKAVKNLMQKKQKPKFELPKQSSLLKQVKNFLPMIQRQNAKLLNQQLPIQKIDAHFEKQQSSSESSDNQQQPRHESTMQQQTYQLGSKHIEMNLLLLPHIQQQQPIPPVKIIEQQI